MTNLVRAGLARALERPYAPMPTVYDGLFPKGTLLTAPTRGNAPKPREPDAAPPRRRDRDE